MPFHWSERELHRLQVRTRHASDLVVGSVVIATNWPEGDFKERVLLPLERANDLLVKALAELSLEKRRREEMQEDGQA